MAAQHTSLFEHVLPFVALAWSISLLKGRRELRSRLSGFWSQTKPLHRGTQERIRRWRTN